MRVLRSGNFLGADAKDSEDARGQAPYLDNHRIGTPLAHHEYDMIFVMMESAAVILAFLMGLEMRRQKVPWQGVPQQTF